MKKALNEKELLEFMVKHKVISNENRKTTKAVIAWLFRGEAAAKKISPKVVENLHEANCVDKESGYLKANFDKYSTIEFAMLILAGDGLVKMITDKKKK